jgi:hypothetical protein
MLRASFFCYFLFGCKDCFGVEFSQSIFSIFTCKIRKVYSRGKRFKQLMLKFFGGFRNEKKITHFPVPLREHVCFFFADECAVEHPSY